MTSAEFHTELERLAGHDSHSRDNPAHERRHD